MEAIVFMVQFGSPLNHRETSCLEDPMAFASEM